MNAAPPAPLESGEIYRFDWDRVARHLDARGNAVLERLLSSDECQALAAL